MMAKLNFSAGVMNIILAASLIVNTLITFMCVMCCVIMPILLPIWFLPFLLLVPLFFFIFLVSLSAMICNMVAGVGTVVASIRGGKISKAFAILSIIVDAVFIPANSLFFAYGISALMVPEGVNWLTVAIAGSSAIAIVFTIVSLVINSICLHRSKQI